jgi:hypothetical protein
MKESSAHCRNLFVSYKGVVAVIRTYTKAVVVLMEKVHKIDF